MMFFGMAMVVLLCEVTLRRLVKDPLASVLLGIGNFAAINVVIFVDQQEFPLLLNLAIVFLLPTLQFCLLKKINHPFQNSRTALLPLLLPALSLIVIKVYEIKVLGISYLCFRLILFAFEVHQRKLELPRFWQFMHFFYFVPTFIAGPINSYIGFRHPLPLTVEEVKLAIYRIFLGAIKLVVLANVAGTMTLNNYLFLNTGKLSFVPNIPMFLGCMFMSQLFVYYNFSGFCDIVIGISRLAGKKVPENFSLPFASVSINDYWTRWNITLAHFTRSVIFYPMQLWMARTFGDKRIDYLTPFTILIAFLLVGLWHGFTVNYFLFGLVHALGLSIYFVYSRWLVDTIGRLLPGYRNRRSYIWLANLVTIAFVCFANIFFDLEYEQIKVLWSSEWSG